jgi:hypothetical protein
MQNSYFTGQEGSGSFSDKEFANFLNISRRSIFECANIIFALRPAPCALCLKTINAKRKTVIFTFVFCLEPYFCLFTFVFYL